MTLQDHVKALSEKDKAKFFRELLEVAEAGRMINVPLKSWVKMYTDIHKTVEEIA